MAGRSTRPRTSLPGCTPLPADSRSLTPSHAPRTPELVEVRLAPIPSGARGLYYVLAAVGIFSLLVGAAVRLRRPDNQATLHFFWLTIAFFGVLAFSFSGRLDTARLGLLLGGRVGAAAAAAAVRPLRAGVPGSAGQLGPQRHRPAALPLLYLPGAPPRAARGRGAAARARQGAVLSSVITLLERGELICLAAGLVVGLAIMIRALGRVRSVTARRQLRWIVWGTALGGVPFVFGYALPYVLGLTPIRGADFTAVLLGLVPLAFASASCATA